MANGKTIAYVWGSGVIEFGPECPEGAIAIHEDVTAPVREVIETLARHSRPARADEDGMVDESAFGQLLVPGVPEARFLGEGDPLEALRAFVQALRERCQAAGLPLPVGAGA